MEAELTCNVCCDIYLEGMREPITLPACGHTFCRQCLLNIERVDVLCCPYCRAKHPGPPIAQMSTVYAILNLTKCLRRSKYGICSNHSSTLDFWCQTCHTGLCGFCLFESQCKKNHVVLVMKNAMDEKKKDINEASSKFLESIDKEKELAMKKIHDYFEGINDLCSHVESLNASIKNIKDLVSDADNSSNMDLAISLYEKMQKYQRTIREQVRDPIDVVCTSDSEANSPACHLAEAGNNMISISSCDNVSDGICQDAQIENDNATSVDECRTQEDDRKNEAQRRNCQRQSGDHRGPHNIDISESATGFNSLGNAHFPSASDASPVNMPDSQSLEIAQVRQMDMASSEEGLATVASAGWLSWSSRGEDGRHGRFRWEGGRLHLYTLTDEVSDAHGTIKLSVILSVLQSSPEVFIDLGVNDVCFGRVYIRLWGDLHRAQHFLALCTGSMGPSYKGSRCNKVEGKDKPGECLRISHYVRTDGTLASRGLMGCLEWSGEYSAVKREGLVVSACGGKSDYDGCFDICTKGNPGKKFSCPFGEVVSGLEAVKKATCHDPIGDVAIINTGVVVIKKN